MLWVDVLNVSLEWRDPAGVAKWMASGAAVVLGEAMHERLGRETGLLRRVFTASYLGVAMEPKDEALVSQWVDAVTLRVGGALVRGLELPALGARRASGLPEPLETLLSTALLQLLALTQACEGPAAVHRCHGLRNGPVPDDGCPPDWHRRFAQRAGVEELVRDGRLHQCQRLVLSRRGGRFCSKSCSNASFAVRKAWLDPRYFAAKQERYRRRQERPGRPDRGAFVFVD